MSRPGEVLIPVFVINLQRREDRLSRITSQLATLNLNFRLIQAIDGVGMDLGSRHIVEKGGVGCWLSHQIAFEQIQSSNTAALVLEDDACFLKGIEWPRYLELLSSYMSASGVGVLQLGFNESWGQRSTAKALFWRARRSFSSRLWEQNLTVVPFPLDGVNNPLLLGDFKSGTHAYLISPRAARDLVGTNLPVALAADAFLMALAKWKRPVREWSVARLRHSLIGQYGRQEGLRVDTDIAES